MRMFIRKAADDTTFGWVIVRIALVAAPLGPAMRANLAADIDAGLRARRFRSASPQAAYDLVLGFGLMGMRSVLRGEAGPAHAEDVAQMTLTALGVPDADEIAHLSMDDESLADRVGRGPMKPASADSSPKRRARGSTAIAGGERRMAPLVG